MFRTNGKSSSYREKRLLAAGLLELTIAVDRARVSFFSRGSTKAGNRFRKAELTHRYLEHPRFAVKLCSCGDDLPARRSYYSGLPSKKNSASESVRPF